LVIYCGAILTDDGKERRVNIDFEPFKPINTSLYLCDNKFHTEVRSVLQISCPLLLPQLPPSPMTCERNI
jgi:peptide subunit release factor 1 (eRF1)